ncbi:MAG: ATP-binding cassette domain-containing protein [Spirochaetales bacterium]|nr:ATP-binding cassette domain-containing protein [Spirochaetales bacterium]
MVTFSQVTKNYGSSRGIQDVSFSLPTGELLGLLGPNGAGKTTIMKLITGFHYPEKGSIKVGELDLRLNSRGVKALIGYLPENVPLYQEMRVREYLEYLGGVRLPGKDLKSAVMRAAELTGLTSVLSRQIGHLSKGYKQRVGLAQAIIHKPKLLILDEPTSGLDPNQILEIRKLIKEMAGETTILFSTHILQEVEALCSQVMIISEGSMVAQGTPEAIASQLQGKAVIRLSLLPDTKIEPKKIKADLEHYLHQTRGSWTVEQQSPRTPTYLLTAPADFEEQEAIALLSPWIWKGKKTVLELSSKGTGIEDLFSALTKSGGEKAQ